MCNLRTIKLSSMNYLKNIIIVIINTTSISLLDPFEEACICGVPVGWPCGIAVWAVCISTTSTSEIWCTSGSCSKLTGRGHGHTVLAIDLIWTLCLSLSNFYVFYTRRNLLSRSSSTLRKGGTTIIISLWPAFTRFDIVLGRQFEVGKSLPSLSKDDILECSRT